MKDFENVCDDIIVQLEDSMDNNFLLSNGDLSDLGNDIGIVIAKYFDINKIGYDKDSFLAGLNHGISLTDGTH